MDKKKLQYGLLKFFAESVLIIGSIILSFYIQGKIEDSGSKKEAINILEQVKTDLISDTCQFYREIKNADRLMGISNHLLNFQPDLSLSNEQGIDSTLLLIGETITNLYTPIHVAGYTRLINFDHKEVVKDNPLLDSIIGYYTVSKTKIDGYYEVDRHYVDHTLVDQYLSNKSYAVLNEYYSRNIMGQPHSAEIKNNIISFLNNQEIRSVLIFNIINKNNYKTTIIQTKGNAYRKIELIDEWLKKYKK